MLAFIQRWSVFTWLYNSWVWLFGPSITPLLGAVAAVVAAFSIDPANWLRPLRGLRRLFQVMVIWLVVVWLLGMIPYAKGQGFGWGGGSGQGGSGDGTGAGPGDVTGDKVSRPGVTVVGGKFPSGLTENVLIQIQFVPELGDPTTPRDFACDVLVREGGKNVQIRAGSIQQFDEDLVAVLREIKLPDHVRNPVASIRQTPFPGTGALLRIEGTIRRTLPGLGLQRDD
jgi:hypothetical protein